MNFFLQSVEYLLALKDKGWGDEGFFNEWDWICHETYGLKILEESHAMQAEIFLQELD